jgi:uncharacterized protein (DUF2062 family)
MLFRRRHNAKLGERVRVWLWPRVSWRRSALYVLKRILRLSGTPYAVAMGSAVGAFVSFTPFIGFHLAMAIAISWLLRGNLVAGALGTFVGNPLTFPAIWAGTYEVGRWMLGEAGAAPERLSDQLAHGSLQQILPLIEPMALGSIPLGLAVGCIVYFIVYKAVLGYQAARRQRLAGRASRAEALDVSTAAVLDRDDHAAQASQAGRQY